MIDYIGFDEECVLMLLSFYAKEKKTLRYVEKAALALYDEGISTAVELQERLCAMERIRTSEGQIRAMFGMTGRSLTTKEKKYISSWLGKMNFDVEMIRLAYEKTVDATHGPSCAYANGILERWFADGIDTPQKVADADGKRAAAKAAEQEGGFDTDVFFEAALKRSYENI
jgi:DnaD/phage-associated family protein